MFTLADVLSNEFNLKVADAVNALVPAIDAVNAFNEVKSSMNEPVDTATGWLFPLPTHT